MFIHFSCLSKLILSDGRHIHKKTQENLRKFKKIQENIFYSVRTAMVHYVDKQSSYVVLTIL